MNVVVIGASGMLGKDLVQVLTATGLKVYGFDMADIDITRPETFAVLDQLDKIDALINSAAYTNVDACETDVELAMRVNGDGPGHLANYCAVRRIYLMHFSTDYVFNGQGDRPYREDDPTDPLSIYGKSKLAGESNVQKSGAKYCILRTQWLYGRHGKNFIETVLKLAREKSELTVVNDQFGGLTNTVDLAEFTGKVLHQKLTGIYHVANQGYASWFEVAVLALKIRGIPTPVMPVSSAAYPRLAVRPKNGRLDTGKLDLALGVPMRSWVDALRSYLS